MENVQYKEGIKNFEENKKNDTDIACILCCLKNRKCKIILILLPTISFFIYFITLPSTAASHTKKMSALLIFLPIVLYICLACCILPALMLPRQVKRDKIEAKNAHKYLQAKSSAVKINCDVQDNDRGRANNLKVFPMLLDAAKMNNIDHLNWCLKENVYPDTTDHLGRTALHWACFHGHDEVVKGLIKAGASLDTHDNLEELTPLHYASFYGHLKITRILVESGASLTVLNSKGMNPLQIAEIGCLRTETVQPSHKMIIQYLRSAMGNEATEPMEHICGLTVMRLLERQNYEAQKSNEEIKAKK